MASKKIVDGRSKRRPVRLLRFEQLEFRRLLVAAIWHNHLQPLDTSGDAEGFVSPIDALLIVNELNVPIYSDANTRKLASQVPIGESIPYIDVNCDSYVTPIDALYVINAINQGSHDPSLRFSSSGGTSNLHGRFEGAACSPRIFEGDSFLTELSAAMVVPDTPSAVEVVFSDLSFDTTATNSIRDAFEIAIVDGAGNSLVKTIAPQHDASVNASEGIQREIADGVQFEGDSVRIGLNGIPTGTDIRAIVRLVNNDSDTQTAVTINAIRLVTSDILAVSPDGPTTRGPNTSERLLREAQITPRPSFQQAYLPNSPVTSSSSSSIDIPSNPLPDLLFDDFADISKLQLNRDASVASTFDGSVLRLAKAQIGTWGSAFTKTQLYAGNFSTAFRFRLGDRGGLGGGADGFVFVIQSSSSTSLGRSGGFLGYSEIDKSIGIEFDTFANGSGFNDPSIGSNHIGIDINGKFNSGPGADTVNIQPDFDNGQEWFAWIDYDGTNLEIRVSSTDSRPDVPNLAKQIDVPALIQGSTAYVGFTAATASGYANFDILSWRYLPYYNPIDAPIVTVTASTERGGQVGELLLIRGIATSVDKAGHARQITDVTVDGKPVHALDQNGQFFAFYELKAGPNRIEVVAIDRDGTQAALMLETDGRTADTNQIDSSQFVDSTDAFKEIYSRTSFNEGNGTLHVQMGIRNEGQFEAKDSLLVLVESITDPSVTLASFDGILADGTAYIDFSKVMASGALSPSDSTRTLGLAFSNPTKAQFGYKLVFLSKEDRPPVIQSAPNTIAIANVEYDYELIARDPDEDTLSYRLLQAPQGMVLNSVTGGIEWSPSAADIGIHRVVLEVGDGRGGISKQNWSISVQPFATNRPPVITSIPTDAVYAPTDGIHDLTPYQYQVSAFDADDDQLSYTLITMPLGMVIQSANGLITWSPAADQRGTFSVAVQVADNHGGVAVQSFQICSNELDTNVTNSNSNPLIELGLVTPIQAGLPTSFRVFTQDQEGDVITLRATSLPAGMTFDASAKTAAWTPTLAQVGNHNLSFEATDGNGGIATKSVSLQVVLQVENRPPQFTTLPRTSASIGRLYQSVVQAIDPNGDPVSLTLKSAPAGMSLSSQGLLNWPPEDIRLGNYPLIVEATDGKGGSTELRRSLTVTDVTTSSRPVITSAPVLSAVSGLLYRYDARAVDNDSDLLFWSLSKGPLGMSIDAERGTVRWMPTESQSGLQSVEIIVSDSFGLTNIQRFEVDVRCVNSPPIIDSIPNALAVAERDYFYAIRATDLENDELNFTLVSAPIGMQIANATGIIRWQPTSAQIGEQVIELNVSDGQGGVATQKFKLRVVLPTALTDPTNPKSPPFGNRPPSIQSDPTQTAVAGRNYGYVPTVVDLDRDALTFTLSTPPVGMAIDPLTGNITWLPTNEQIGEYSVQLKVKDSHGAEATQNYQLKVRGNQSPTILSTPKTLGIAGAIYRYYIRATDADGDQLTYGMLTSPDGMEIDLSTGIIVWPTSPSDVGSHSVEVSVTDKFGAVSKQAFTVSIIPDSVSPTVAITVEPSRSEINSPVLIEVHTSENIAVVERTLTVDGQIVPLDGLGRGVFIGSHAANVHAIATAKDAAGNVGSSSVDIQVVDPTDNSGPTVNIFSPAYNAEVTYLTNIVGSIRVPTGQTLSFYRVEVAPLDLVDELDVSQDNPNWRTIANGTAAVENATIATFDPTLLPNGAYMVRIIAFTTIGKGWVEPLALRVSGNAKIGEFSLDFTDLTIPLAGIPIEITRHYSTLDATRNYDFGFGWRLQSRDPQIVETGLGASNGLFSEGRAFVSEKTKVYLTNPDGKRIGFTYREEPAQLGLFGVVSTYRPVFIPDPGVYDQLAAPGIITRGLFGFLDYNPSEYTLTTKEGLKYRYLQNGGLQQITDLNGNTVAFKPDRITHSSGQEIRFVRDNQNRIREIIDPSGNRFLYSYDANGDLRRFVDQLGNVTRYSYHNSPSHYLNEAFDSLGNRSLKVVYDEAGRFQHVQDAFGQIVRSQSNNLNARIGIVRDARGNETKLEFDVRGNVLTETDSLGLEKRFEYEDARNPDLETRIVDKNGHVTIREYDARGNLVKNREFGPESSPFTTPIVTSYANDSGNHITSVTDALQNTTRFSYDSKGNFVKVTNAKSDSALLVRDKQGRLVRSSDFNGNLIRYEYDAACPCGSPSKVIYADHSYETFEHNQFGQEIEHAYFEADGKLVELQRKRYDNLGRLIEEVIGSTADGSATTRKLFYTGSLLDWEIHVHPDSVDATGRLIESPATPIANRKSSITDYQYDANNRLIRQVDAEGGVIEFRYDADGNRIALRDPVGNLTTWIYDAKSQPVEERDPLYWDDLRNRDAILANLSDDEFLELVAPVNPKVVADPLFDNPSGASCETNHGADHVILTCYDGVGNVSKKIDRNGRRTEFDRNYMGDMTEERWYSSQGNLVRTIAYTYDAAGNMLSARDPDSSLAFTYDSLGQQLTADNAGTPNVPRVLLTYNYDANGNVAAVSDSSGVTVASSYNARNLLEVRQWFDSTTSDGFEIEPLRFQFDYNAAGRKTQIDRFASMDQSNLVGHVFRGYDNSGRSSSIEFSNAIGRSLSSYRYSYDALGRMNSSLKAGINETYSHDRTGQLTSAIRSNGINEFFAYDANGNRIMPGYHTSIGNHLVYDGTFTYGYDGEGNRISRTKIDDGTVVRYEYDHRNRLLRISQQQSGAAAVEIEKFTYDALNRRSAVHANARNYVTLYDREHAWTDLDQDAKTSIRYCYDDQIDTLLAIAAEKDFPRFVNTDLLGSVIGYVSVEQVPLVIMGYDAFGSPQQVTDLFGRIGFTGREAGLNVAEYYYRARYFDPESGVFTSEDPLRLNAGDTNLYRYVFNAPLQYRDPTGTESLISDALLRFSITVQIRLAQASVGVEVACVFTTFVSGTLQLLGLSSPGILEMFGYLCDAAGQAKSPSFSSSSSGPRLPRIRSYPPDDIQ